MSLCFVVRWICFDIIKFVRLDNSQFCVYVNLSRGQFLVAGHTLCLPSCVPLFWSVLKLCAQMCVGERVVDEFACCL